MAKPSAFVRHKTVGDFAVTYELNAYCGDARGVGALYTALHRNIPDVLNEHGYRS